jgi:protein-L-isoaspartate(D-aspartate) O-methyltransferase
MTGRASERAALVAQLRRRGIRDARVLRAFARVPREAFVPVELTDRAYADAPLPIGYGQTISQPYVVALTVEALAPQRGDRVLEVGTGSGYAAAILAHLAREVVTIERIPALAAAAAARLARLGYRGVRVETGDGSLGARAAPGPDRDAPQFDAICVAAAAPVPPPALLAQLAPGGRLVLPHGDEHEQRLTRITRGAAGEHVAEDLGAVRFVPLIGAEGWPEDAAARDR